MGLLAKLPPLGRRDSAPTASLADAIISPCEKYRYRLTRRVGPGSRRLVCILLNPSTANAKDDDPTVSRLMAFAKRLGYDILEIVNLFAFRTPSPSECVQQGTNAIGPDNDRYLNELLDLAAVDGTVLCAWGNGLPTKLGVTMTRVRAAYVLALVAARGLTPYCFGTNDDGSPKHPLARGKHRIPDDATPVVYDPPSIAPASTNAPPSASRRSRSKGNGTPSKLTVPPPACPIAPSDSVTESAGSLPPPGETKQAAPERSFLQGLAPLARRPLPYVKGKERYIALGARCWTCPLARHRAVPTEYRGEGPPALALVGEAPGRREVMTGKPFVGASGTLLNYALKQSSIPRTSLAVLNAAACGPIASDNDVVKNAAVKACRPRLIAELRLLAPKGVLAIGAKALGALAPDGTGGITVMRGAMLSLAPDVPQGEWNPPLSSTYHPAHILRGGDGDNDGPDGEDSSAVDLLYYFFLFDLAKTYQFAMGMVGPWEDNADLFVDQGGNLRRALIVDGKPTVGDNAIEEELLEALERVITDARAHGELTCDVETDGRDSLEANLTAIGYGTPNVGVCATWAVWQMFPGVFARLRALHADRAMRWNWWNGIYDRVVLRRHKLAIIGPSEDGLLKHHAAFPGLPHNLQAAAAQFFITAPWKAEFRSSARDVAELVGYCSRDVRGTARLSVALDRFLVERRTERVYEADRQVNVVATRMREVGLYVDRDEQARHRTVQTARLQFMQEALLRDFASIEEPWRQNLARLLADKPRKTDPESYLERVDLRYREIGERAKKHTDIGLFKPKAKADIVALFTTLHIPITDYTKKGSPVTDKKAMEGAAARHPLMRRLIHMREAQHLIATYIELPVKRDGRMHPDWRTFKITGRWGAGKSQNVPNNVAGWPPERNADGTYKVNALGSFVTPRENMRSLITAPTAAQVLEIEQRAPGSVDRWVLARAKRGFSRRLVGADQDQQELRGLAYLSKDPFLLKIFNEGRDPHSEFAHYIFPTHFPKLIEEIKAAGRKPKESDVVEDEVARLATLPSRNSLDEARLVALRLVLTAQKQWKRLRDFTKRVEFGGAYGGKALTIWTALVKDMPEVELANVEHGLNVFYEKAAGVPRWHNDQEIRARLHRETREALLGRVRLFPLGNYSPTVIRNFPIQSLGASLIALAILRFTALVHPELLEFDRLYRFGLLDAKWVREMRAQGYDKWHAPVELVSNGHDALLAECDEEDAERVAQLLTNAMTQELTDPSDGTRMVFSAGAKISQRWSRT